MLEIAKIKDIDEIMINIDEVKKLYHAKGLNGWKEGEPGIESVLRDIKEERIYVWRENKRIVGSLMFACDLEDPYYQEVPPKPGEHYALIHRLTIRPGYQKRCIAEQMLQEIEEKAKEKSMTFLRTGSTSENRELCYVLEKCGYQKNGAIKSKDGLVRFIYEKKVK